MTVRRQDRSGWGNVEWIPDQVGDDDLRMQQML
jgi:hypothetical protein